MLAIPINDSCSSTISDLYGNVPYFAFLDTKNKKIDVKRNEGQGNGFDTADFIKKSGVSDTVFFHMGKGIFDSLNESGIRVYSVEKEYLLIDQINQKFLSKILPLVTKENADTLLDSGNSACSCGCERS